MFSAIGSALSQRSQFTKVKPLPSELTRAQAVNKLHDHNQIIRANPLVTDFHAISKPEGTPADEMNYTWYEITDKVTYFPGFSRDVVYRGGFLDTPDGVTTHVYAPAGLEIRERWSVCEAQSQANPASGDGARKTDSLVLCEDVDMTCNVLLTMFVKKQLMASHNKLTTKLFGIE